MSETITSLLNNQDMLAKSDRTTADCLRNELEQMLGFQPDVCRELDENSFDELFNEALPTAAIDANYSFTGAELIGLVNALNPDRRINIIYTSTATAGLVSKNTIPFAQRGFIIAPDGAVYFGDFPHEVQIDLFETVDLPLQQNLAKAGVSTMSDVERIKVLSDKKNLELIAEETGLQIPRRVSVSDLLPNDDIVIKPAKEAQGLGVFFGSKYPGDVEQWTKYYTFLDEHGYSPLIEERIRPWPIEDPYTGQALDWNIRAIVCNGQFIDMYARIAPLDNPVNKSAGASAVSLQALKEYFVDSGEYSALTRSLENAATDFAERLHGAVVGLDLTVNDSGEVVMYEANVGPVGGLQTMASLSGEFEDKIKNAYTLLEIIQRHAVKKRSDSGAYSGSTEPTPIPLTDSAQLQFLAGTDNFSRHGHEIAIQSADTSSQYKFEALVAKLNHYFLDAELSEQLANSLIDEFPLQLVRGIRRIAFAGRLALGRHVDGWLDADPKSADFRYLSGIVAIREGNFAKARQAYNFLLQANRETDAMRILSEACVRLQQEVDKYYPKKSLNHSKTLVDSRSLRFSSIDEIVEYIDNVEAIVRNYYAISEEESVNSKLLELVGEESDDGAYERRLLGIITLAISEREYELTKELVEVLFTFNSSIAYEFVCEYLIISNDLHEEEVGAQEFRNYLRKHYSFGEDYVSDL